MNELTFNILKIVLSVASALIAVYLVPLIRTKIKDAKYQQLLEMVDIAVRATEQAMGSEFGSIKKVDVIKYAHEWMEEQGITISEEQLSRLIECCVYNMKREGQT